MEEKQNRTQRIYIRVNAEELDTILQNRRTSGIVNLSEYIRKMALRGYIIKQDFPGAKTVITELKRIGNNVNQLAKAANNYGIDVVKIDAIRSVQKELDLLWQQLISTV